MKSHGATRTFGLLTSGGDCPGLDALIRGVADAATTRYNMNIIGFAGGFRGLIDGDAHTLKSENFSGMLIPGGSTRIGDSTGAAAPRSAALHDAAVGVAEAEAAIDSYRRFQLDCIVAIGGYDALKTAYHLSRHGLNVIAIPKTINNNIWCTDITYGFHSAVEIACEAIGRLHSTARSHNRIMVTEVMGHTTGWLALYAGLAADADVILMPETPYRIEHLHEHLKQRAERGIHHSIVVVAEGALSEAQSRERFSPGRSKYHQSNLGYHIAEQLESVTGIETRVTVLGHQQRGGAPSAYDRILATRFGAGVADMLHEGAFGRMAALKGNDTARCRLAEVAGMLRKVPPQHDLLTAARAVGTCFGTPPA